MMFGIKEGNRFDICTDLTFEHLPDGMMAPEDAILQFSDKLGQTMIDELWQAGFRPTAAPIGDGRIQAMSDHLGDMRKLVEKTLRVKL